MSIVIFLFLAEGIYIITVSESTTSKLERLIKLNQVEILRKHLLIQIYKVKSDFLMMDGVNASTHEVVATNVSNLQTVFTTCADCHHRPAVQERIKRLLNEIDAVRGKLQQFLTTHAMGQRTMVREMAHQLLEHLEIQVNNDMIHMAAAKLSVEANDSTDDIARSKMILYVLVALTPLVAGTLVFFLMGTIAKPVDVLLEATRRLKSGDLDYHIGGLNGELGELAASLNQMSDSLRTKIFRLEDKLRQSEQEWFDTFNAITDMITLHDNDFNILKANTAAQKVLGLPKLHDTQAKCYNRYHGQQAPPDNCSSCQSLKTGKPGSVDVYEPHLGKLMELRAIPRFDADGQMIGVLHISRDISERKRMEENLQRAHQMKLVGEWATALAHEIKNPLAGIKVSVEVLAEELEAEEDRAVVEKTIQEIGRIKMLLKSLLNFAKPPKPHLSATDLNGLLDKSLDFALKHPGRGLADSAKIGFTKNFDHELPPVRVDPMQFQQIFLNLILNAVEAMPRGGQISVTTRHHPNKRSIVVDISDTGKGIERSNLDKIFQPFFTTTKKGTGLGLAITKRLVEQHDGQITVISEPGQGTTISIVLPIKEGQPT